MAIAVQTTSLTDWGSYDPLTVNKPASTANGDLLIAIVGVQGTSAPTAPAGWTSRGSVANSQNSWVYLYDKVASSEGASWDWDFTSAVTCIGLVIRVNGQEDGGAFDAIASDTEVNSATPSFTNGIDPTTADQLLVMAVIASQNDVGGASGYAIATNDPTWTERADNTSGSVTFAVATAVRSSDAATGNSSVSLAASTADSGSLLASYLREPAVSVNVSPAVISAIATVNAPTVSGGANVSPAVITATTNVIAPTVITATPDWTNPDKTAAPSWVNPDKS